MGNIAKILLVLIIISVLIFPAVALKIRGLIFEQETTIANLEKTLAETREELAKTKAELESTKSELESTKSELERTKRDLATARARIQTLEGELRNEKSKREKAEADLRTARQELASAREEIKRKDGTISTLQREKASLEKKIEEQSEEIERLKKIAGIKDLDVTAVALADGIVLEAAAGGLIATFAGNLGLPSWSNLFVSRRGQIAERVSLKQLHGTNVVFRFDPDKISGVQKGDTVILEEGANVIVPELFEGLVPRNARQGFFAVEVDEKAFATVMPKASIYRGRELVAEVRPEGISAVVTVVEILARHDVKVLRSDTVRMER